MPFSLRQDRHSFTAAFLALGAGLDKRRRNPRRPIGSLATVVVAGFALAAGACGADAGAGNADPSIGAVEQAGIWDNPYSLALGNLEGGESLSASWYAPPGYTYKFCWKVADTGDACDSGSHQADLAIAANGTITYAAGVTGATYDLAKNWAYVKFGPTQCGGTTYKAKVKIDGAIKNSTQTITTGPCVPRVIVGPDTLCPSASRSYSFSMTTATTFNWQASGGLSRVSSDNGTHPTVQVYANGTSSTGTITLSADNYPPISRTIASGAPARPTGAWFNVVLDDGIHCFSQAVVAAVPGATSYAWSQPSYQVTIDPTNSMKLAPNRTYPIGVIARNACGDSPSYATSDITPGCTPPQ